MNGKPALGAVGGLVAALIGAAIWATVTVLTEYKIGWIAVGVGALVGLAVRVMGRGSHPIYAVMGGGFALLGCVLGNLFSSMSFLAKELEIGYFQAFGQYWNESFTLLQATFSGMDILFYAIAIYQGVKLSIYVGAED